MSIKGFDDWISLGGKTRRYKNVKTGEILSRWEFDRRRLGATRRQLAKESKKADAIKFYAQPARGRKSARKLAPEVQKDIAEAFQQKESTARKERLKKRIANDLGRRVKIKKVRPSSFKSGHRAIRRAFNDYDDLIEILDDALGQYVTVLGRRIRMISAYAIGLRGYDENRPERGELDVTVQRLTALNSKRSYPKEGDLDAYEIDVMEEKPYFTITGYWVHLAVDSLYADKRAGKSLSKYIPPPNVRPLY